MFTPESVLETLQPDCLPQPEALAAALYRTGDLSLLVYFNSVCAGVRSCFLQDVQEFCESGQVETQSELGEILRLHLALLCLVAEQIEEAHHAS